LVSVCGSSFFSTNIGPAQLKAVLKHVSQFLKAPGGIYVAATVFVYVFGWAYLFHIFLLVTTWRVVLAAWKPEHRYDLTQRIVIFLALGASVSVGYIDMSSWRSSISDLVLQNSTLSLSETEV